MSVSRRILVAFVLVQLASAALVAGWYFYIFRGELIGLTRQNVQDSVVRSVEAVDTFFRPAEALAEAAHYLLEEDVIGPDRPDQLERYFLAQLRARPQIAGLYVGYPDGSFFYVMKSDEEGAGGTRTKIIRVGSAGREVSLTWRDPDSKVVKSGLDPDDQYDPRTRDWYSAAIGSDGQVWTEPYVFFTSGKPGITLASAIKGGGGDVSAVLGVDIEISALSGFLTKSSLGVRGTAYIVTEQGSVIAHSAADLVTQDGKAPRFRTLAELDGSQSALDDRILKQFGERPAASGMAMWDTDLGGRPYLVAVGQMESVSWPWQVVVMAPRSVGEGSVSRAGIMLYSAVAMAMALALIVGYSVARSVGRPLAELVANARLARRGNVEVMEPVETSAREIVETDEALRALAQAHRERGGAAL